MKIAYLHNLPLEYYPPATNFLNLAGRTRSLKTYAFTTSNRKQRKTFQNNKVEITRNKPPNPAAWQLWRVLKALWWHLHTAISLAFIKPDAIFYVEPHSALAAWIYFRIFFGRSILVIHHHEYYEQQDFLRPGMRLPHLGSKLERNYLFHRAVWISQTNEDRLCLAQQANPKVSDEVWHLLPNYPPSNWSENAKSEHSKPHQTRLRLIYVGSASYQDTYIEEVLNWALAHPEAIELHICGYNVSPEIWNWLKKEKLGNVSFDDNGYEYEDLPEILKGFDVGLVLYKGNTTNFIYNVPNKVFEYLLCGLEVWYPKEMRSIRKFHLNKPTLIRELNFAAMDTLYPANLEPLHHDPIECVDFTAEKAFEELFHLLGVPI